MQLWEAKFCERNIEIIKAKKKTEKEAHNQIERLEKEAILNAARKAKDEEFLKR